MNKYIFLVFFVYGLAFGQNIQVISNQPITQVEQGKFFYPQVSPTGDNILFTSERFNGIWLYNNSNGKIEKIVEAEGAGYEPKYSDNGNQIVYRKNEFINSLKYSSIHKIDLNTKNVETLENKTRNLTPPLESRTKSVAYVVDKKLVTKNISNNLQKIDISDEHAVTIENSKMIIYSNGERVVYTPLGEGNYLWPSISHDGTMLLFTFAGKGTFITDFDGNIISELEFAHYPSWSNDDKWIVFMEDHDDGYKVITSEIFVASVDGVTKVKLTNTDKIKEMYPKWSSVDNEIVYNTTDGVIYKLKLKID